MEIIKIATKKAIICQMYVAKKEEIMEKNQKINCTVETCKFNNIQNKKCELQQIMVTPINECHTKNPDESMCSSYENNE